MAESGLAGSLLALTAAVQPPASPVDLIQFICEQSVWCGHYRTGCLWKSCVVQVGQFTYSRNTFELVDVLGSQARTHLFLSRISAIRCQVQICEPLSLNRSGVSCRCSG